MNKNDMQIEVLNFCRRFGCNYLDDSVNWAQMLDAKLNSEFCFLSIDVLTYIIDWKFIWRKRVELPKVWKKIVNFRPTVSRGWLLVLTSQEDGSEIVDHYTLRLLDIINTVNKFLHPKFRVNWMNISL